LLRARLVEVLDTLARIGDYAFESLLLPDSFDQDAETHHLFDQPDLIR
jgi:hypothetical protein